MCVIGLKGGRGRGLCVNSALSCHRGKGVGGNGGVCMCVCMDWCSYVYTNVFIYVYTHVYMYIHACICMYARVFVCMYVRVYVRMYIYIYVSLCARGTSLWSSDHVMRKIDYR